MFALLFKLQPKEVTKPSLLEYLRNNFWLGNNFTHPLKVKHENEVGLR